MLQPILDTIIRFAQTRDDVLALILIGSQARAEQTADAFSDTDLILAVRDVGPFVSGDAWLAEIGPYHISFTEPTFGGQTERRVLFDGAQDVDFVIIGQAALQTARQGAAADILQRGYRVLVDKCGPALPPYVPAPAAAYALPGVDAFLNTVQDFWYHAVWAAKKLLRGELWTAKFCVDGYMKEKLLWMIERHEHAVRRFSADTWYRGRFIERWAADDVLADLQKTFAHYNPADIAAALWETMNLFRRLALEAADACGFAYPSHADEYTSQWVAARLEPLLRPQQ